MRVSSRAHVLGLLAALAVVVVSLLTVRPVAAETRETVPLKAGCTPVQLTWPAGTPLAIVAAAITPRAALRAVWRYDSVQGRHSGYAPTPGARNEYTSLQTSGERAVICMKVAGKLTRPVKAQDDKLHVLPPGAALPSGEACAARVRPSVREARPGNEAANRTSGTTGIRISGASATGNARLAPRIDGDFSGTTDEIMQWAACKWGMDEDIVRAMAMQESAWRQAAVGRKATFGLLQIKPAAHPGTFPASRDSTAFNVDYGLAWWRACFEGYFTWVPDAARGDVWGCVGLWFSGRWRDADAERYITLIRRHLAEQPWLRAGF